MKIVLRTLKKTLFWSYERGSWQYDLMCVLILAFIFFAPNNVFDSRRVSRPLIVRSEEIGEIDPNDILAMEKRLRQNGHAVTVSRIEKAEDSSGETIYVVWLK
ncbi:MAG: hypothetical protein WAV20_24455 [Blastocatellia bacterium]